MSLKIIPWTLLHTSLNGQGGEDENIITNEEGFFHSSEQTTALYLAALKALHPSQLGEQNNEHAHTQTLPVRNYFTPSYTLILTRCQYTTLHILLHFTLVLQQEMQLFPFPSLSLISSVQPVTRGQFDSVGHFTKTKAS